MPNIQFTLLPRSIQIRLLCGNNTSFDGSTPYFVARKNSSPDRCKRSGPEGVVSRIFGAEWTLLEFYKINRNRSDSSLDCRWAVPALLGCLCCE